MYTKDYFRETLFDAAAAVIQGVEAEGIRGHSAALRWTLYHSALRPEYEDDVVIGTSLAAQLTQSLDSAGSGPLPCSLVQKFEDVGAKKTQVLL
jgi:aflatoxin B1 aldehyde reductase